MEENLLRYGCGRTFAIVSILFANCVAILPDRKSGSTHTQPHGAQCPAFGPFLHLWRGAVVVAVCRPCRVPLVFWKRVRSVIPRATILTFSTGLDPTATPHRSSQLSTKRAAAHGSVDCGFIYTPGLYPPKVAQERPGSAILGEH